MKLGRVIYVCFILSVAISVAVIIYSSVPSLVLDGITERRVECTDVAVPGDVAIVELMSADSVKLRAWTVKPDTVERVVVTLAGIGDPSATMYMGHARMFRKHNIATVMLDLRAHGGSGGDRIGLGYTEWRDVAAAVDYIRRDADMEGCPVTVMGVSMGGAVAINSGALIDGIDRVISMSGYSAVGDLIAWHAAQYGAPRAVMDDFTVRWDDVAAAVYGVDPRVMMPKHMIERMGGKDVLLIHSRDDSVVPVACRDSLLAHAAGTVDTLTVAGDRHMVLDDFSLPEDNPEYAAAVLQFILR